MLGLELGVRVRAGDGHGVRAWVRARIRATARVCVEVGEWGLDTQAAI